MDIQKLILFSELDIAGSNIAEILVNDFNFLEKEKGRSWIKDDILLARIDKKEILYLDSFKSDENFIPSVCIVASKHSSKTGKPTLTAHFTGNFSKALFGGEDKTLEFAQASYLKEALLNLAKNADSLSSEYEICIEATHHGPTKLPFPVIFVEIGSTISKWNDKKSCKAVAKAIYETASIDKNSIGNEKVALGFGGGHYSRKFTDLMLKREDYNISLGHICPKYNLENLDSKMLNEMIEKTIPRPSIAFVERKGMGKEKRRIINMLEDKTELAEIIKI